MDATDKRKKLFAHNRGQSLFQSFSNSTAATKINTYGKKKIRTPALSTAHADYQVWSQLNLNNNESTSRPISILQSPSISDSSNSSSPIIKSDSPPVVGLGLELGIEKLAPLEFDNNKENISWEAETTEVLRKIRPASLTSLTSPNESSKHNSSSSLSSSSSSTSSPRISRLVRAISTISTNSISSKDTIDGNNKLNRISQQSSVSTIQRYSIGSTSTMSISNNVEVAAPIKSPQLPVPSKRFSTLILDSGNLRRSSVAQNLSQILQSSEDDEDDEETNTTRNIPGIVVPFPGDGEQHQEEEEETEDIGNLNIPSYDREKVTQPTEVSYGVWGRAQLIGTNRREATISVISSPVPPPIPSPAVSNFSGISGISGISNSLYSPSISSSGSSGSPMLSYKRDGTNLIKHKKVTKGAISGPTSLVNHQDFFASRPSIDSNRSITSELSRAGSPAESGTGSIPRSSSSRYGSSFLSSLTPHASMLSLRSSKKSESTTSTTDPVQSTSGSSRLSKHAHKLSLVNGFSKKASIQDMKRLISFSPSSSSLFRIAQGGGGLDASGTNGGNINGDFNNKRNGAGSNRHSILSRSPGEATFDKSMISLPTPVDGSREKLRNKLRASSSLLSLARSDTSESLTIGIPIEEYEQNQLQALLGLCSSFDIQDFTQYIEEEYDGNGNELSKLAEASFSEVFIKKYRSKSSSKILKIIPFGNEELDQLPVQDIIQELTIARMLMSLDGFVNILSSSVVKGSYPRKLLELWDSYHEQYQSQNYRPDFFKDNQLYCIIVMTNAGTDLEHFELSSWHDAESIFWQVVNSLANAEDKFDFEHRDLHWGNIVIDTKTIKNNDIVSQATEMLNNLSIEDESTGFSSDDSIDSSSDTIDNQNALKVTIIDYTLSRAMTDDGNVVFTRLDHPDFFRGRGDYQFDIYRFMRSIVGGMSAYIHSPGIGGGANGAGQSMSPSMHLSPDPISLSGSNCNEPQSTNWSYFCPKTNVLWLHYLVDKLLNAKSLPRVSTTRSGRLSFGGGSNGSLREAYLKGQTSYGVNDEARACRTLENVHKSLDPRKKRFGGKKNGGPMTFQDFNSAKDILKWGIEKKYVPEEFL